MNTHHGNTPAAWIGVAIVLVGFVVGGVGLLIESMPVFWLGVVIAPLGGIVGMVLGKMGLGADVPVDR